MTPCAKKPTHKPPGCRTSAVRSAMLKSLTTNHCQTAEQLMAGFPKNKRPHKTTIYREIVCLLDNGLIHELNFGDGRKTYELADNRHHHHLICLKCGWVHPIFMQHDLEKDVSKSAKKQGFTVTKHSLEFFGYCQKCN
ncbi:MAG TPA: transcriptional repressor [bacterium]|nr:MAG: Zinc uptake regulation protein [Parcubacteria group bacterium ADurb.Bin192]HPN15238.1 transcriptional repressor [bacterium]